jgi:hypothetical protein
MNWTTTAGTTVECALHARRGGRAVSRGRQRGRRSRQHHRRAHRVRRGLGRIDTDQANDLFDDAAGRTGRDPAPSKRRKRVTCRGARRHRAADLHRRVRGAYFIVHWYAYSTYYVGNDAGTVAVYQGQPGRRPVVQTDQGLRHELRSDPTASRHRQSQLKSDDPESERSLTLRADRRRTSVHNGGSSIVGTTTTTTTTTTTLKRGLSVSRRLRILATIILLLFAVIVAQSANIQFFRAPGAHHESEQPAQ